MPLDATTHLALVTAFDRAVGVAAFAPTRPRPRRRAALARGTAAREARRGEAGSAHRGHIGPRPDALDPHRRDDVAVSASQLEMLGTCGFRHEAERARERIPPPSESVYRRELADPNTDTAAFVEVIRSDTAEWLDIELRFDARRPQVPVPPPLTGGGLGNMDYEPGSACKYGRDPRDDGCRLQRIIQRLPAERLLDAAVEQLFPTRRAKAAERAQSRAELS